MINTTYKAPEITVIIFYPRIKHGKGGACECGKHCGVCGFLFYCG